VTCSGLSTPSSRTPFVNEWRGRRDDARREAERLRGEVLAALRQGRAHELVPFAGQSAGLLREIQSAAEIVRQIVADAEQALARGNSLVS
jgi:enoyl-[acyl-carrier protein] reductase II